MTHIATSTLQAAAATQIGREHQRLFRNNQDGLAFALEEERCIAVVTDGCSSGRFSEVGARLGAGWLVSYLRRRLRGGALAEDVSAQQLARDTAHSLAQQMRLWAADIGGGGCAPTVVADYFLFTFVAAVAWREQLLLFGMGDGVMGVDGALTVRDSGTDNTPAYAAYLALAPNQLEPAMSLEPWSMSAPPGWKVALIGTDGVAEVCDEARRWQQDPRYRRHPLALQRRLVVLSERERRLTDDTTAVLIHRSEA